MGRKSQWFIYLTFPSPDVVEGHWTMASSHCYSVTPLVIADHVEPELNIITSNRWDLTCLHDVKINLQCHWVINISARTEIWFKNPSAASFHTWHSANKANWCLIHYHRIRSDLFIFTTRCWTLPLSLGIIYVIIIRSLNVHGHILFTVQYHNNAGCQMVKQDNLTPWMISEHFYLNIKWERMKESIGKKICTLINFWLALKKKKSHQMLSNPITSSRWKGTEKPAVVFNIQCDCTALIWIQTIAKVKEFLHLETRESLNPYFKFKSLGISLCLSYKKESRPVKTADCISN